MYCCAGTCGRSFPWLYNTDAQLCRMCHQAAAAERLHRLQQVIRSRMDAGEKCNMCFFHVPCDVPQSAHWHRINWLNKCQDYEECEECSPRPH